MPTEPGDDDHTLLRDYCASRHEPAFRALVDLFGQQLAVFSTARAAANSATTPVAEANRILNRFSMRRSPIRGYDFPAGTGFNDECKDFSLSGVDLSLTTAFLKGIGIVRPAIGFRSANIPVPLSPVLNYKVRRTLETHSRFDDLGDAALWNRGTFSNDGGFVGDADEAVHNKTRDLRHARCTVSDWKTKCRAALGDDDVLLLWREMYNGIVPGVDPSTRTFDFGTRETKVLKEFLGIPCPPALHETRSPGLRHASPRQQHQHMPAPMLRRAGTGIGRAHIGDDGLAGRETEVAQRDLLHAAALRKLRDDCAGHGLCGCSGIRAVHVIRGSPSRIWITRQTA